MAELTFQQRMALENAASNSKGRVKATGKGDGHDRSTLLSLRKSGLLQFIGTDVIVHSHEHIYRITEAGMQALEEDRALDAERWEEKMGKRGKKPPPRKFKRRDGRAFIDGDEIGKAEGWFAIVIPPAEDGQAWLEGLSRHSGVPLVDGRFEFNNVVAPLKFLEYVASLLHDDELDWYARRSFMLGGRPRPPGA